MVVATFGLLRTSEFTAAKQSVSFDKTQAEMDSFKALFINNLTAKFKGERILVIGTCEYVWPPFLAALSLENQGALVKFASTTRSPIQLGHSIQAKFSFNDNYGLGMPNFIYNIQPESYDRIVIIAETSSDSIDPEFFKLLPNSEFITYDRPCN